MIEVIDLDRNLSRKGLLKCSKFGLKRIPRTWAERVVPDGYYAQHRIICSYWDSYGTNRELKMEVISFYAECYRVRNVSFSDMTLDSIDKWFNQN